jgi:hypothetical protein
MLHSFGNWGSHHQFHAESVTGFTFIVVMLLSWKPL